MIGEKCLKREPERILSQTRKEINLELRIKKNYRFIRLTKNFHKHLKLLRLLIKSNKSLGVSLYWEYLIMMVQGIKL
jgi:hypothetical protein